MKSSLLTAVAMLAITYVSFLTPAKVVGESERKHAEIVDLHALASQLTMRQELKLVRADPTAQGNLIILVRRETEEICRAVLLSPRYPGASEYAAVTIFEKLPCIPASKK